jgi:hypothetical protein
MIYKGVKHGNDYFVVLRASYMYICKGRFDAATVLSVMDYWTNIKLKTNTHEEPWIYKTVKELVDDTNHALSRRTVESGLQYLVDNDLLLRRRNPRLRFDRTYQYMLNVPKVQELLDAYYVSIGHPAPGNNHS